MRRLHAWGTWGMAAALSLATLAACQSLPAAQLLGSASGLPAGQELALEAIEAKALGSAALPGLVLEELALQAAYRHGLRLKPRSEARGDEAVLLLRLDETPYEWSIERYQSIALRLLVTEPGEGGAVLGRYLITEDTSMVVASAGYLFTLFDRLFERLAAELKAAP